MLNQQQEHQQKQANKTKTIYKKHVYWRVFLLVWKLKKTPTLARNIRGWNVTKGIFENQGGRIFLM